MPELISLLRQPSSRRGLLRSLPALGAWLPFTRAAGQPMPAPAAIADVGVARLRAVRSRKASSYDRSGGNADFFRIPAGATQVLLETAGPGVVRHIWATIAGPPNHLKDLVLRMHWDAEPTPSVEAPIGDFFGLNLNEYLLYASAAMSVASIKALNCYLPMPFRRSARITVTNEGPSQVEAFYSNIDYEIGEELPSEAGYFHAQYRQAAPCRAVVSDGKNRDGKNNYVVLEAMGRGHYVGITQGVLQNADGWWGEGDDMIFIDGASLPTINGTGSEDYFNGAWDFGGQPFHYPYNGAPSIVNPERTGGRWCLYRWHLVDPIRFERSLRVTLEHGTANNRSDNYYTVAYWYQTEPHAAFPPLPPRQERYPRLHVAGAIPSGE